MKETVSFVKHLPRRKEYNCIAIMMWKKHYIQIRTLENYIQQFGMPSTNMSSHLKGEIKNSCFSGITYVKIRKNLYCTEESRIT